MDAVTIATQATALLLPYIVKGGEKFAETLAEKLPDGIRKMWSTIISKFRGNTAAETATRDLEAAPSDADNQAAFRKELRKVLEQDGTFAAALGELVRSVQSADSIVNTGSGAVATHGSVAAGQSGVAVGGNVGNISKPEK